MFHPIRYSRRDLVLNRMLKKCKYNEIEAFHNCHTYEIYDYDFEGNIDGLRWFLTNKGYIMEGMCVSKNVSREYMELMYDYASKEHGFYLNKLFELRLYDIAERFIAEREMTKPITAVTTINVRGFDELKYVEDMLGDTTRTISSKATAALLRTDFERVIDMRSPMRNFILEEEANEFLGFNLMDMAQFPFPCKYVDVTHEDWNNALKSWDKYKPCGVYKSTIIRCENKKMVVPYDDRNIIVSGVDAIDALRLGNNVDVFDEGDETLYYKM